MGLPELHAVAGRNGFATANDVHDAEVDLDFFRRHAQRIGWEHRRRGCWVPAGFELSHTQRAAEAISGLSEDVLLTGRTALFLYGVLDHPGKDVELLVPAKQHYLVQDGVCLHRTRIFDGVRYQHRKGFRLALPARAFADFAPHASLNDLCCDLATAMRKRQCTLPKIAAEIAARKRWPGRRTLRIAHGLLTGELKHSADEGMARRLLREAGHRPHHEPLTIESGGRLLAEIDIPFVDVMYGVEIDGPHHLLPDVAAADRQRDRALEKLGWLIDRFFWFELEERTGWVIDEIIGRLTERVARA